MGGVANTTEDKEIAQDEDGKDDYQQRRGQDRTQLGDKGDAAHLGETT